MRTRRQVLKEIKLKEDELINFDSFFLKNYIKRNDNIASLTDTEMNYRDELFSNLYDELDILQDELNNLED